ncbi:alpha/beta hydrolase [Bacillus sp. FJAT-45350]|uniref:alpha/beta hydrolase n=1 Tax=Bacillus sp. FJAT-45350 TaxID=2011014 RepID=UPI000BB830E1|nr:alpha/beta hydrolase-fold protein [Bacillus sp. FJAT-45350]
MVKRLYGKRLEESLFSKHLQENVSILLYLPPNYSPLYTYDLLIAQDGDDYFRLGRIATQAEELIVEDEIKDIIIVGIPYPSVEERRERYHPKGSKHKQYLRFLAEELLPYLDQEFHTHQLAAGRTLIGDSLGATVSFYTTIAYPNSFGQLIMQSPYVNDDFITNGEKINPALSIYHVIGTGETEVKTTNNKTKDFLSPNRKLKEVLSKQSHSYFYNEFEGDHTWLYWQQDLKAALKMMFNDNS